jgi:hypothetical protein
LEASLTSPPTLKLSVPRQRNTPLELSISFASAVGEAQGSVGNAVEGFVPLRTVWRGLRSIHAPVRYNAHLTNLTPNAVLPQGTGYLGLSLGRTGNVTIAGRLADGTAILRTSLLGVTGELPLRQLTPISLGSVQGWLNRGGNISGELDWLRHATTSRTWRSYRTGIPLHKLNVTSSAWRHPSGLALPLALSFALQPNDAAGLTQGFNLITGYRATVPKDEDNPHKLQLSLQPTTGVFYGSVQVPRGEKNQVIKFSGLMSEATGGMGYALLPAAPYTLSSPLESCMVSIAQAQAGQTP